MNRRQFIQSSAALAFPTIVPVSVLGRPDRPAPSDRLTLGHIGVGNMGSGHVRSFSGYPDVQIRAVCDVRDSHAQRAKQIVDKRYGNSDCLTYRDFRELLAREDIDAVCIATPDHWHVLIGMEAARQGKHMYYEKPMGRSIEEAFMLRKTVQQSGVVFQFGTQQRSDARFRLTCDLVRNGKIGELETIMIGSASYDQIPVPLKQTIPEGFNYDFWLGPASWVPYSSERCTRQWTLIYDYSLGCVSGAWGIHQVDIAQWINNTDHTYPISAEGTGYFPYDGLYDTAQKWEVEHRYANGVRLIHMDMHTALKRARQFELFWMGVLFLGSEGWIYVARGFMDAHPKSLLCNALSASDDRVTVSPDHRYNFVEAVRNGKTPMSPVAVATRSDIICHHADIAMQLGRRVEWDPVAERFINDDEANRRMKRAMRSPWHL